MRRFAALLPVLALGACTTETPPPAAPRPPGEVYQAPDASFLFVRPPNWRGQIIPRPSDPARGASGAVEMRLRNLDVAQQQTVLTIYTFAPGAWRSLGDSAAAVGSVVFEDSARVLVAVLPSGNPYPALSPAAMRFDSLSLPLDTIRARIIVR